VQPTPAQAGDPDPDPEVPVDPDPEVPVIVSVDVPAPGTYYAGSELVFVVTWDADVRVFADGSVGTIPLTIGSQERQAVGDPYAEGCDGCGFPDTGPRITFRYIVQRDDVDTDGIVVGDAIVLADGALIRDTSFREVDDLTLSGVGTTTEVLVDGSVFPSVTTTSDSGPGSLRAAITAANALAGPDTILFAETLACATPPCTTITLSSELPPIAGALTITGPGAANLTLSGAGLYLPFVVGGEASLKLSGITIAHGLGSLGGAIFNNGTLEVTDSTFHANYATANGGAISNGGTLKVTNSTFSENSAKEGGAIDNSATLEVTNSTFFNNSANRLGTFDGGGGGIRNRFPLEGPVTATVTNSTFSGNAGKRGCCAAGGGAIYNAGTLHLTNTILANSTGDVDCRSDNAIDTSVGNLIESSNSNCGTPAQVDDPLLGGLADNGGPTKTMALAAASPARDAGTNVGCPATDQRGFDRPVGEFCDIGAFEFVPPAVPGVPQDVSALWSTLTGVEVSFTAPATDGGSAVTSYGARCTSTDGGTTRSKAGASSPLNVTGLTEGKTYRCQVRAINAAGRGAYSGLVDAVLVVPGVPRTVSAAWSTFTEVVVSFTAPATNGGSAVTDYAAECTSTDGGTTGSTSGASSPLTVPGLSEGSTYDCRVRATNALGDGAYSGLVAAVLVAPGVPQDVSALWSTSTGVAVSFTAPATNGGSAVTSYGTRCTSTDGGTTRSKSGASSPLNVTGLTEGKTYRCQVRAINAAGRGAYSGLVDPVLVVPGVPRTVSAAWSTLTEVVVKFTAPATNGGSAVTDYAAECTSTDGGTTGSTSGASSPLTVPGLTEGRTYDCRVRATNAVGDGAYSELVAAVLRVPGVPQDVLAGYFSQTGVEVLFTPPATNGGSAVTSYGARCTSTDGGTTRSKSGAASPLNVTGLTEGRTYRCQVRAINAVGRGAYSGLVDTAVPAIPAPGEPGLPGFG
jgi:hypothetical protein